jgi:hypothetical protein
VLVFGGKGAGLRTWGGLLSVFVADPPAVVVAGVYLNGPGGASLT